MRKGWSPRRIKTRRPDLINFIQHLGKHNKKIQYKQNCATILQETLIPSFANGILHLTRSTPELQELIIKLDDTAIEGRTRIYQIVP